MRGKPLWLGLAGLWVIAACIAAVFVVSPGSGGVSKPDELAVVDRDGGSESAPLNAPKLAPEVLPADTPEGLAPETTPKGDEEIPATPDDKPAKPSKRESVVIVGADANAPTSYGDVDVAAGGTWTLPAGEVKIDGNLKNSGTVSAANTTLIFDGSDQTLEGTVTAKKVVLRGGTKRIKGSFGTTHGGDAQPGNAGLYVEAGTTLIIEKGGKWTTPNPYGFQIAGNLIIEGGEFHCRFSNGNGTDRGEESWLAGSTLTIHSGKFVGGGDADFSGCAITIHDGALEINDDIWNSGDSLTMLGGSMRNTTGGGMFYLTGTVSVSAGKLDVYQNNSRSLRFAKDANIYCTGGQISINGSAATGADGGIYLGSSATVPNLVINADTKIHKDSLNTAYLSVSGDMSIAKGRKFEAHGFNVLASFPGGPDSGEFVP